MGGMKKNAQSGPRLIWWFDTRVLQNDGKCGWNIPPTTLMCFFCLVLSISSSTSSCSYLPSPCSHIFLLTPLVILLIYPSRLLLSLNSSSLYIPSLAHSGRFEVAQLDLSICFVPSFSQSPIWAHTLHLYRHLLAVLLFVVPSLHPSHVLTLIGFPIKVSSDNCSRTSISSPSILCFLLSSSRVCVLAPHIAVTEANPIIQMSRPQWRGKLNDNSSDSHTHSSLALISLLRL